MANGCDRHMRAAYATGMCTPLVHGRTDVTDGLTQMHWSPWIDLLPLVTRTHRREGG